MRFRLFVVLFITLFIFGLFLIKSDVFAEQSGSSPSNNSTSRVKTIYDSLVSLTHGSDSTGAWGDWGAFWNRIYSAATWTPNGNAMTADCKAGVTFYSGNSRTQKVGGGVLDGGECTVTADCFSSVCTQFYQDSDGDSLGNAGAPTKRCASVYTGYVTNNTDCNDTTNTIRTTNITGGTITTSGSYKIHTFTSGGNLTVSCPTSISTNILLVGGGGGSNTASVGSGSGGGGGQVVQGSPTLINQVYGVTIANGGAGGAQGGTSAFGGLYSAIGGYPGYGRAGGASGNGYGGGADTGTNYAGSGGGGAGGGGATGYDPEGASIGGNGGVGLNVAWWGWVGGGGAGQGEITGSGGTGGGGTQSAGTAGTGGGAGGASWGGAIPGGSGIAVVRYLDP
jgi:hypothetical protein